MSVRYGNNHAKWMLLSGVGDPEQVRQYREEAAKSGEMAKKSLETLEGRKANSIENMKRLRNGDVFNLIVTGDEK